MTEHNCGIFEHSFRAYGPIRLKNSLTSSFTAKKHSRMGQIVTLQRNKPTTLCISKDVVMKKFHLRDCK
jgi:hypothetical protein